MTVFLWVSTESVWGILFKSGSLDATGLAQGADQELFSFSLSFFFYCFYLLLFHFIHQGSLSKHCSSMILGYFIEFGVFYSVFYS